MDQTLGFLNSKKVSRLRSRRLMPGQRRTNVWKLVFDLLYSGVAVRKNLLDIAQMAHYDSVVNRSHPVTPVGSECDDASSASRRNTGPQNETGALVILQRTYPSLTRLQGLRETKETEWKQPKYQPLPRSSTLSSPPPSIDLKMRLTNAISSIGLKGLVR